METSSTRSTCTLIIPSTHARKLNAMKQCPICQSLAFDDATTCFGCLHEFTEADQAPVPGPPTSAAPSFTITLTPTHHAAGHITWSCAVDLAR